jgi:hypothetical protein
LVPLRFGPGTEADAMKFLKLCRLRKFLLCIPEILI